MKYNKILEEELKNKVGVDWFKNFDTTEIIGKIDFSLFPKQDNLFGERMPLLWAEAKRGDYDVTTMFVQLILTIGKARTFDKTFPPAFLGAFDFKKIAFVPYISIEDIFYLNDFNWNVTPSNHETKEFKLIKERVEATLKKQTYIYDYEEDEKDLKFFITNNIANASTTAKIRIDKNNFIPIYLRWLEFIKPIIEVNWDELKQSNILDSDFYLADLFVDDKNTNDIGDDATVRDNLFVIYQNQGYKIAKENLKAMFDATINIKNKDTYQQFWKRYKRPPLKIYQEYIIERRDLLVPQDIRERKGAFFTPRQWVELSQKYITDYLGADWQDEYYIWDCAAGTGNLLTGLTNKYNIYASTLDQADVKVMHDRIEQGANLLEKHVFQFDFLNDDFSKLPQSLQDIINDEEKRKKLVIYINPPYAEASNRQTIHSNGENKSNVATNTEVYKNYSNIVGTATRELFAQFFLRIYNDLPNAKLCTFSTLKYINSQYFIKFREFFKVSFIKGFVVPANTFDNVKGAFPIGFSIFDLNQKDKLLSVSCDVYNSKGLYTGNKVFFSIPKNKFIIDWLRKFYDKRTTEIAFLRMQGTDMQNNLGVFITNNLSPNDIKKKLFTNITANNLIPFTIYFSARKVIKASWLNDRDQFLFPNNGWENDSEFQNDCLTYSLFSNGNNIQSQYGINHWIPFTEQEVNAQAKFESNFMTNFIKGKYQTNTELNLFDSSNTINQDLVFSDEAKEVFDAGRELWKYYHAQPNVNVNASFYDIREYFQGRNDKGRMNSKSSDETYTKLIGELRNKLSILAEKITPKIYEYEFLKE